MLTIESATEMICATPGPRLSNFVAPNIVCVKSWRNSRSSRFVIVQEFC